jgi:hypothetical protein
MLIRGARRETGLHLTASEPHFNDGTGMPVGRLRIFSLLRAMRILPGCEGLFQITRLRIDPLWKTTGFAPCFAEAMEDRMENQQRCSSYGSPFF